MQRSSWREAALATPPLLSRRPPADWPPQRWNAHALSAVPGALPGPCEAARPPGIACRCARACWSRETLKHVLFLPAHLPEGRVLRAFSHQAHACAWPSTSTREDCADSTSRENTPEPRFCPNRTCICRCRAAACRCLCVCAHAPAGRERPLIAFGGSRFSHEPTQAIEYDRSSFWSAHARGTNCKAPVCCYRRRPGAPLAEASPLACPVSGSETLAARAPELKPCTVSVRASTAWRGARPVHV